MKLIHLCSGRRKKYLIRSRNSVNGKGQARGTKASETCAMVSHHNWAICTHGVISLCRDLTAHSRRSGAASAEKPVTSSDTRWSAPTRKQPPYLTSIGSIWGVWPMESGLGDA
jgi:hypothetical protein